MPSLLKSALLAVGLLAGVTTTGYAQSVSALPPTTQTAVTPPLYSPTKIRPNPGGSEVWRQVPNQPMAAYRVYPLPDGGTVAPSAQDQPTGPRPN